jgi:hypothetical protein
MHSRGVSKPVFKVLNAMGITESYDSAMESIEGLRSHAMNAMNAIHGFAKSLRWLIAYDNLDVTVDTHEQTVGSQVATRESYSLWLLLFTSLFQCIDIANSNFCRDPTCVNFPIAISRRFSAVLVSPSRTNGRNISPISSCRDVA